jgi:hypothetical protein
MRRIGFFMAVTPERIHNDENVAGSLLVSYVYEKLELSARWPINGELESGSVQP